MKFFKIFFFVSFCYNIIGILFLPKFKSSNLLNSKPIIDWTFFLNSLRDVGSSKSFILFWETTLVVSNPCDKNYLKISLNLPKRTSVSIDASKSVILPLPL